MTIAAVLLAAGASTRLGEAKQLLVDAHGEPLVRASARRLLDAGCSPVVIVLGAEASRVSAAVHDLPVRCVMNAEHAQGMGRSIAAGMGALAEEATIEAALIAACDMPGVTDAHLRALIAASHHGTRRVASSYPQRDDEPDAGAVLGIPAVFPRTDWPFLLTLEGDRGARGLLREQETLSVFLRSGSFDLDTPADVARWRRIGSP